MHFQSPIQNWPRVLAVAPERCFIKAFEGGMLVDAKAEWARLGRDPAKLHTDFRHYDFIYPFDNGYTFAELKEIWRINFDRFVDRTYLERYAAHIDSVEELNEYYDTRMAHDPAFLAPFLASAQAAVAVWNDEYRGQVITSADGGQGLIPAGCRLVIGNSPVGNDIAREFFALAVSSDNILGIHPYSKWENLTRDAQDFRYHSGRPFFHEAEYGIKPIYAPTECGPYLDSGNGWRYSNCMNADLPRLIAGMRAWVRDVATTAAYREGRILGPGAFFTSGGFGWAMYQYTTDELVELYKMLAVEWRPPALQEVDVDEQTKTQIRQHAQAILDLVNARPWVVGDVAKANTNPLVTYTSPNGPVFDRRATPDGKMITYDLNVEEVSADKLWLRVSSTLWVKATDVKLKGT